MFGQTSPENARIIARLQEHLSHVPLGAQTSYVDLNRVAGCDVASQNRWLLQRAVDLAEESMSCAFATVRGYGIKRLPSEEISNVGLVAIRKVRKAARKGKKRLDRANTNSLSDYDRRRVTGMSSMLGAIELIADGRKAIAVSAVADPVKPIPPENILDMFKQK